MSVAIGLTTLALCFMHYVSVTWTWFAERPDVARPLRLDRPDSFGHWILCVLLAASSGISFLVYQLRRHRNDDFRGHYQLWRLLMFVFLIGSVHSLVGLLHWGGSILDAVLGQRVALTGNDWLRLLVSVGGAITALRLVAEVRKSRFGLSFVLIALGFLAIPEAVNWNLLKVETIGRWTLVTSAPLIGCTALFLGLVGYLRMVFRDVRRIEDTETIAEKLKQIKSQWLGSDDDYDYDDQATDEETLPKRRWWGRRKERGELDRSEKRIAASKEEYDDEEPQDYDDEYEEDEQYDVDEDTSSSDTTPRQRKRRWFGLRRGRDPETLNEQEDEYDEDEDEVVDEQPKQKRKRRGWSLRLKPNAATDQPDDGAEDEYDSETDEERSASDEDDTTPKKKKKFSLGWRKNKNRQPVNEVEQQEEPEPAEQEPEPEPHQVDDEIDPDEIDWNSLSKSERRRLRKKLKRQKRAA